MFKWFLWHFLVELVNFFNLHKVSYTSVFYEFCGATGNPGVVRGVPSYVVLFLLFSIVYTIYFCLSIGHPLVFLCVQSRLG